jgi:hypothetical protein
VRTRAALGRSRFPLLAKELDPMTLNSTAGDPGAESYFSLADASTYFTGRGVAAWTGSDAVLEAAARLGTAYLENQYRGRWVGIASTPTQALAWPRSNGYRTLWRTFTYPLLSIEGVPIDITSVPVQVQRAAMEAALLSLSATALEPVLDRGGQVKSQSDTVGPIGSTTVWQDGAPVVSRYLVVEGLLRGLVNSTPGASSGNVQLVRC